MAALELKVGDIVRVRFNSYRYKIMSEIYQHYEGHPIVDVVNIDRTTGFGSRGFVSVGEVIPLTKLEKALR